MRRTSTLVVVLALVGLALATSAQAQEDFTYRLALLGGVGGSLDAEPSTGLENESFELSGAFVTDAATVLGLRAGRITFDAEQSLEGMTETELDYYTVVGEYRYRKGFYDSGIFLGLGDYRLRGTAALGERASENAIGIAFGVNGELRLARRFYVLGQISVHYAFFNDDQIFGNALVGLAVHF